MQSQCDPNWTQVQEAQNQTTQAHTENIADEIVIKTYYFYFL